MDSGTRIGWGIIGVGDVTEVKAAPEIFRIDGSTLVRVMRRDPGKARDYAVRHGIETWGTDPGEVIDDPAVDVVYIATPTASHAEYAIAAARAGKHVLVEKPMAMSQAEAAAMVEAARANGVKLWVAYYRRALPRFATIRGLLQDGAIGEVLSVQSTWRRPAAFTGWRWDPALNRGGEFAETACHTLDVLDHLVGPISGGGGVATADAHTVAASFRLGEVPASGTWTFGSADEVEENVVVGTAGTLRFATFAPTPIRVTTAAGTVEHPVADPPHVHGPLVASIVAELHGRGTCPSTGDSALRTAGLVERVLA
ncbi:Predicted dehydrogenase [Raineyella antarctica]|uniref:Predicted dehydrogenase n=1 Tax=Raineyella antarctica TaxID=1577474 RepID=A0A1G6HG34_9ACTN|nr:Gfo/Idh/MocA family oxidoreductase [Raineyella antarctica]SDB92885.1 Predicted dehydrogenase [Raineyella antarctica]